MVNRLSTVLLFALALPAGAQTVNDIRAAAGGTMDMLVCSAFFALESDLQRQAAGPEAGAESNRRASVLVMGAGVLRTREFGEEVKVGLDTAQVHADRLRAILRETWDSRGKAFFDEQFQTAQRMPYCIEKARGIAAALKQGLGQ